MAAIESEAMTEAVAEAASDAAKDPAQERQASEDMNDTVAQAVPDTRALRLARIGGVHLLVWLAAMGLFAATDSWNTVTALPLAGFLCVIAGVIAGITTATLIHEWFHFFGAMTSKGAYGIPARAGLFIYDWDFKQNTLGQFYRMSVAGTIGGVLAVLLVWFSLPADSWGRAAFHGGALAAFVFGSVIEWPVLSRTRVSGDPFAELSKITPAVLMRSLLIAAVVGVTWASIIR